jgi:hypothetical protein
MSEKRRGWKPKDFDGKIGRQQEGNVVYLHQNGTEKTPVKDEGCQRRDGTQRCMREWKPNTLEKETLFICISKNGLQVDLEEESSKGNYYIGG